MMQTLGIIERAQSKNIGKMGSGNIQWSWRRAGGKQQRIKRNFVAIIESDRAPGRIQVRRAPAGAQVDALLCEPFRRLDDELHPAALALEILRVQARAVVGTVNFLADEKDRSVRIALSNRLGRRTARQAAADQNILVVVFQHHFLAGSFLDYTNGPSWHVARNAAAHSICCAVKQLWSV